MTKMKEEDRKEFEKQAAVLLKDVDDKVHYAKKSGQSTLCGRPIPPAKESALDKKITCKRCKAELGKAGVGL